MEWKNHKSRDMVLLYNLHFQQISDTCKITLVLLCEKFLQRNICSFALRTEQYQQLHLYTLLTDRITGN